MSLRYQPYSRRDRLDGPRRVVEVEGVAIEVATLIDRFELLEAERFTGRTTVESTTDSLSYRITAPLVGAPSRLSAWIGPGSYFIAFGRQDALLGDPPFDDRYLVRGNDVPLLRAWIDQAARDAIAATYDPLTVASVTVAIDDGRVTVACPSPEALDRAITACARIASRAQRLTEAWRGVAATMGLETRGTAWTSDGRFALVATASLPEVVIDFPDQLAGVRGGGPRTRVTARHDVAPTWRGALWRPALPKAMRPPASKLRDEAARIGGLVGYDSPAGAMAALGDGLARTLARAAPDAVACDEASARLWWNRWVDDRGQLQAGIDAVSHLVARPAPSGAPYR